MRVSLSVTGSAAAARALREAGERLSKPMEPLLSAAAAMMATFFQTHIREERGPDGPWPELAGATMAIRKWYGWGPEGPKLVRAGDLLQSITTLDQSAASVEVGTRLPYAAVLQTGGTVTDEHGRTRTVQTFPFVFFAEDEASDLMEVIEEYFLGAAGAA